MKADLSRRTFNRTNHYSAVVMQQGRVTVDADWNEQHEIERYRVETETVDVVGACGTPLDPPDFVDASGFEIALDGSATSITIGAGRYYVDGLLAENDAKVAYADQAKAPYELPVPPAIVGLLSDKEVGLAYLDVWRRHVTPLDDPLIQEKALGDADTATRIRTAWQVKVLPLPGVKPPVTCNADLAPWDALVAASSGKLTAETHTPATTENLCEPPPKAGFTRLENQLYRVEIHEGTQSGGDGTFKWSRENGSILTDVRSFDANNWITVGSMGRDEELGFAKDQWVELVNDFSELNTDGTLRGQLTTIIDVNPGKNAIRLADAAADTTLARHPRLRRWDMVTKGAPDNVTVTTTGVAVQPGVEVPIEDGISVTFSDGSYHDGDYWLIPARTSIGDIEWPKDGTNPRALPPVGVRHHYCRLGFVQRSGSKLVLLSDCRNKFPPLTELTSFFYVGGDGQEVMPEASSPDSTDTVQLPEPLQVGVANGAHPVEGATVRFEIFNPAPGGTVNGKADFVEVATGADGVASCTWAIASNLEKQQVRATLRVNAAPSHIPVIFSAGRSRADDVRYFPPPGCKTFTDADEVQTALDTLVELVHLSYVSGDAQEVAPADVGNLLPLEVRAWSACGAIEGATVEFKLLEGGDTIESPAVTDGSGLAKARWVLDQNNQRQRAVATLVDLGPNAGDQARIHPPTSSVEFIANLDLGGGEPDQPVITIRRVFRGDNKPLVNDDDVAVLQLLPASTAGNLPGIVITTDRPVDPRTVVGKKTLNISDAPNNSSPTCFVSIDLPWPASPQDRTFWGSSHFPLGFETIILAAEVRVDGNQILWTPANETRQFLLQLIQNRLKGMADRVLAHLTLKGYFICDKLDAGAEATYLDGEPFGPRQSVGFNPRSGDRRPGGDFEMWFWLVSG